MNDGTGAHSGAHDVGSAARLEARRSRVPRQRRGEVVLGGVCVAGLAVSLLVVMGFIPGIFGASPLVFAEEFTPCPAPYGPLPSESQSRELPAEAWVDVLWSIEKPGVRLPPVAVSYSVVFEGLPILTWLGTNGTGSFASQGGSYSFNGVLLNLNNTPSCVAVVVTTTVSYALV